MSWAPLLLSFQVALAATALAGVVGIAVGAALARRRLWGRELLDSLITAPMVLPPTVLGYYLLVLLGRQGALGSVFERLLGTPIVFSRTGAVVAAAVGAFPFVVKSTRAAVQGVDPRLVDAARTLGAGPLRAFVRVTLPLALPGVVAGLTLGFARALGDFGVTLMVAGNIPGRTQTAALAIYDAIESQRDADAAAMASVLTALAIGALYVVNVLSRRRADAL